MVVFCFHSAENRGAVGYSKKSSTNMPPHKCPHCSGKQSWNLRRNSRKCKSCRREWTPQHFLVDSVRSDTREWRVFLRAMLRYRTSAAIRLHIGLSLPKIIKMSNLVRTAMKIDTPRKLSGTIETDETYIGGMWHNKPWKIRKFGTKKGRGTSKQPVFGLLERDRGVVLIFLVPNVRKQTLLSIIERNVVRGSIVYSDGYQLYQNLPSLGYEHEFVDHNRNEFARGSVSTNAMEGFWGILKRKLKTTGGISRGRLHLHVAEEAWRYNHRNSGEKEKIERLLDLLRKVGG